MPGMHSMQVCLELSAAVQLAQLPMTACAAEQTAAAAGAGARARASSSCVCLLNKPRTAGALLEEHLELLWEGEEGQEHAAEAHEQELKEQQPAPACACSAQTAEARASISSTKITAAASVGHCSNLQTLTQGCQMLLRRCYAALF